VRRAGPEEKHLHRPDQMVGTERETDSKTKLYNKRVETREKGFDS